MKIGRTITKEQAKTITANGGSVIAIFDVCWSYRYIKLTKATLSRFLSMKIIQTEMNERTMLLLDSLNTISRNETISVPAGRYFICGDNKVVKCIPSIENLKKMYRKNIDEDLIQENPNEDA